jgi:hypothetical protein
MLRASPPSVFASLAERAGLVVAGTRVVPDPAAFATAFEPER